MPIIQTIEMIPIQDLLQKMQKVRTHTAILLDKYGGISGMVTVEVILEELVGEIRKANENHYLIDSKVLLADVEKLLFVDFEIDGYSIPMKEGQQIKYIEVKKAELKIGRKTQEVHLQTTK